MSAMFEEELSLNRGESVYTPPPQPVYPPANAPVGFQGQSVQGTSPYNPPQFQGMNLAGQRPVRVPGSPLINFVIRIGFAKDENGANKVLLVVAGLFVIAAIFSGWYFFRTPDGGDSPYPIIYFEDVTPAELNLIPPGEREAYLQSLPSRK